MKIMFVGDISLGDYYTCFGHGPRSVSLSRNIFDGVSDILSEADIVVGNLEAPLTSHNYDKHSPASSALRGRPESATALQQAGFGVLQVANNHTVQHGYDGFFQTIEAVQSKGMKVVGVNNAEATIVSKKGRTVGFLAASDVPDNTYKDQDVYQRLDEGFIELVKKEVNKVDDLFVLLHWGLESSTKPLAYQDELATKLREYGVRGVIGSHPHLFYPVWSYPNYLFAPSLGNFVFDLGWDRRLLKTGILEVELISDAVEASLIPVEICSKDFRPIISSDRVKISDYSSLYELGSAMKYQQIKKLWFFFRNILKGDTRLKLQFIAGKFAAVLKGVGLNRFLR